jgi:hypothetical protein
MVNAVLERLYRDGEVVHRDGRRAVTLETGFAYGMSALFLAEALRQNGGGRHIAIDPFASSRFDRLGLAHLEEAGLGPSSPSTKSPPSSACRGW